MLFHKRWFVLAISMIALSGCGGPQTPPMRMGSLPYPSMFFSIADPADLGEHRFGGISFQEAGRGIIYSERGGFIDLAHIRITADWAWYYYRHVYQAIDQQRDQVSLAMNKGSRLHLTFHYPEHWDDVGPEQRPQLIHQLSLRISQELSWIMGAWHEIATWYGYSRFIIGSERLSAFTHDDTFSHLVGLWAFEQALDDPERDYNAAMTVAIDHQLDRLHAVSPAETEAAIERVRGRWWEPGGVIRRYLELSLDGEPQRPWLAPDEPGQPGRLGESFLIPRLGTIGDHDYSNFYTVQIRPNILEAGQIRRAAHTDSTHIKPFEHFPHIMEDIRDELLEIYGPDADQP